MTMMETNSFILPWNCLLMCAACGSRDMLGICYLKKYRRDHLFNSYLYLIDCIPLEIFSLPPTLKTLFICNCRTLEFSQPKERMNLLEDLYLWRSCDSLQNFHLNYFPKLISLSRWDCRNLECLSVDKELHNELTSLDALEIKYCPKFRSFLEEDEF
ncbi:hypothetical protein GQ457_07G002100 [Hibiscus cannabinus]